MYRLLLLPGLFRSASDFLYFHRSKLYIAAIIAALAVAVLFALLRIYVTDKEAAAYEEQVSSMSLRLSALEDMVQEAEALTGEVAALRDKVRKLEDENLGLKNANAGLEEDLLVLEEHSDGLLAEIQWVEQAKQRPQPADRFKITFYSTEAEYEHLIPGKTVAMNTMQVADLGLKRGDMIYVKSNKGWSGFYTITDSGCAYGTIDIYVAPGEIPSYGVEYDVEILI